MVRAQITSSIIKANFGVEGDLEANYSDAKLQNGNDDWFNKLPSGYTGEAVIDTTGAADILSSYASDPNFRKLPFYRTMSVPAYTVVNNRMWIDAVFIRDYHGDDSTMFASGASKNGMSPQFWTCPVAQSVPDKNEILDMMVHVRRAGPNFSDSLWMFGGVSIENTTGDRYFDFEMYQTDIYYDRASLKFYGYGPDAGHTSWKFDTAGNVTAPGDIIFSADYGSSTLSSIEARIWVDKSSLSITPAAFNWSGSFDGAASGSQFGYAGIVPKSSGAFYVGTENDVKSTWAGPFALVRGDNSVVTDYTKGQFMEFGVNLTKLGLDPVTLLGSNNCGMPFRRVLVKSRSSTSFTAALKDFVGPFDFFLAPRVAVDVDTTSLCGFMGESQINITNPVSTSVYTWSTLDGHINRYNSPTSIVVDSPGTYIVTQKLQNGCEDYAADTVTLLTNPLCIVLQNTLQTFTGNISGNTAVLHWTAPINENIQYYSIERSMDGNRFYPVGKVLNQKQSALPFKFTFMDNLEKFSGNTVYYRIKLTGFDNQVFYSNVIKLNTDIKPSITITPNPVYNTLKIHLQTEKEGILQIFVYDMAGKQMMLRQERLQKGITDLIYPEVQHWSGGIYTVKFILDNTVQINKIFLTK